MVSRKITDKLVQRDNKVSPKAYFSPKSITSDLLETSILNSLLPLGTVLAMMPDIAGAKGVPGSGVVLNGWMLCDGTAIPAGQLLSGNTPTINDDRYLRGSISGNSGNLGGGNNINITSAEMPSHIHEITVNNSVDNLLHSHAAAGTTSSGLNNHSHTYSIGTGADSHFHGGNSVVATNNQHTHFATHNQLTTGSWRLVSAFNGPIVSSTNGNLHHGPHTHTIPDTAVNGTSHSHSLVVNTAVQNHSHSVNVNSDIAPSHHSHPITIGTSGASGTFNIEPQFLTCVYIVRVS